MKYHLNNFIISIIWKIFANEKKNEFKNDKIKEKLIFKHIYLSQDLIFSLNSRLSDREEKEKSTFEWITRGICLSKKKERFMLEWTSRKKEERFILKWILKEKERFILEWMLMRDNIVKKLDILFWKWMIVKW